MSTDEFPSISRPLMVSDLDPEPQRFDLEADESDRTAIAERFQLIDVAELKGDIEIARHGAIVRVAGTVTADLGRMCVVSLEPMRERITEDFAVEYTTDAPQAFETEIEAALDAPEPLEGDRLDLRDVLLEQLVLAMSPHPRKEGAKAPEDPGAGDGTSPFDVLKGLKG